MVVSDAPKEALMTAELVPKPCGEHSKTSWRATMGGRDVRRSLGLMKFFWFFLFTKRTTWRLLDPHPGPLPEGEGEEFCCSGL